MTRSERTGATRGGFLAPATRSGSAFRATPLPVWLLALRAVDAEADGIDWDLEELQELVCTPRYSRLVDRLWVGVLHTGTQQTALTRLDLIVVCGRSVGLRLRLTCPQGHHWGQADTRVSKSRAFDISGSDRLGWSGACADGVSHSAARAIYEARERRIDMRGWSLIVARPEHFREEAERDTRMVRTSLTGSLCKRCPLSSGRQRF
jgi:hypothetical protein